MFGCSLWLAVVGCSPSGGDDARGVGTATRLSAVEWTSYVADGQYLQRLAKPDVPVSLNLADPRQHAFVVARLKLAGKEPATSPHLFELLEQRRRDHVARGLPVGTFAPSPRDIAASGLVAMHYIEAIRVGPRPGLAAGSEATATASTTFPGGTNYTYVDVGINAASGAAIAPVAYYEQFDNPDGNTGANVTVSTTGDPSKSSYTRYAVDSYTFEDTPAGGSVDSYVHATYGSRANTAVGALPQLSAPTVDAPVDTVGPNGPGADGTISACMDRNWTHDCDYIVNTGSVTDHRIKLPLKGAVTLTTQHVFDRAAILALQTALNQHQAPASDPGQVKLVLTNIGGGCDVDASGALNAGMSGFWNYVMLSADNKTLSWDVTGDNALYFDEGCNQIQNVAKLTMRIPVPVLSVPGNIAFSTSFTITSDPDALRPSKLLPPITLTNSCLAEGTQIELGDGTYAAVESLHIGETVFNAYAIGRQALTIQDTAQGVERAPMVRIRDAAGASLLMTEMHPIATPDRGMVQARGLRVGDRVMTVRGPSALVEVSREPYRGKVYNLKVGAGDEVARLGVDQTVVRANGFIVGDGQIQAKYEALAQRPAPRTIEQIPAAWHRDYLASRR